MSKQGEYVLGLDLGANSVGWALIEGPSRDKPERIVAMGTRVFEAGVEGTTEDIERGKDKPRNEARRLARQQRRQAERRAKRIERLARALTQHGLLPKECGGSAKERDRAIKELDKVIYERHKQENAAALRGPRPLDQLPYYLRARALECALEPFELGRAIFHLGQRRGFLSNRKVQKEDEDEGVVKQNIATLGKAIAETGSKTLGAYLAALNPAEQRLRNRWTSRKMYEEEFEAIWEAQRSHHPDKLTDDAWDDIEHAIFSQRKLKSVKGLIGRCDLEPGERRAPIALLECQRFRVLQKVNDLRVIDEEFLERPLTPEERSIALDLLDRQATLKFTSLRKELKLGKSSKFNLERGGEKELKGNTTAAKLRAIFGDRWDSFSSEDKARIVDDLRSMEKEEALKKRGMLAWGLNEEQAEKFGDLKLEPGYLGLSRKAVRKLLPLMEQGMAFATAKKEVYKDQRGEQLICDELPLVDDAPFILRNPSVHRTLSETRRVVNAIIRKYGKPDYIHIELARDLKRSRDDRADTWEKNRQNQRRREEAAAAITKKTGHPHPSREDIERYLLAVECKWKCPYTGKAISPSALFGEHSQFDIEHIIPYSRCLDNSYMNKTLCHNETNRSVKRNRTPHEAFSPEQLEEILARVKDFNADRETIEAKLRRFRTEDIEEFEQFAARKLNDTRYASTLAKSFLGLLYGGDVDSEGKRRVYASTGQVTSDLRWAWNLHKVLGDGGKKERGDHRHHAIDALVIALTTQGVVAKLSKANEQAGFEGRRRWTKQMGEPWPGFVQDVQKVVEQIITSHKVSHKVNGKLHEETNYSRQRRDEKNKPYVHVRKPLDGMSINEAQDIVDPAVRKAVLDQLYYLGSNDPGKAFKDPANLPKLPNGTPIRRARVKKSATVFTVGGEGRERHVVPASNHHMEIIEVTDKRGNTKWEDIIVDQFTAMRRLYRGEPVIQRDHGEGKRFVMSLAGGDIIELTDKQGVPQVYIVRSVSKDDINYVRLNDARLKSDIQKGGAWGRIRSMSAARKVHLKKLSQSPLGDLRPAND